jgi:uncharacterized protein
MKSIALFTFILMNVLLTTAQQVTPYIEVIGSAEMNIVPDEVELEIVMSSADDKVKAQVLETHLFDVLKKNNISESQVTFLSVENPYYWYWWWSYRFHNARTYKITIDCSKQNMSFIQDLNVYYVRSIRISKTTHSKITEYRRQVKVEAMRQAQEKALELLESIGQSIGKVIEVIEMPEPVNANFWYNSHHIQNITSNAIVSPQAGSGGGDNDSNGLPSIKLRFEIKAKFEIK